MLNSINIIANCCWHTKYLGSNRTIFSRH